MANWDLVEEAPVPDDDGTLYLLRRGRVFSIHVDERELMANDFHGSEDALADLAADVMDDLATARVLVGGLGMGFTLAAMLRRVGPGAEVTVAELMEPVVRWSRTYTGAAAGHPLDDPRTRVHLGDVADPIDHPPAPWSAILLDVDNGPRAWTRPTNGWLYTPEGLERARLALRPGGVLGIWSATPDDALTRQLDDAGYDTSVTEHIEPWRPVGAGCGRHHVWIAVPRP